ncbi:hypothetical protein PMAYCL1PPCAC_05861, partial [Pristionchus mayeri]
DPAMRLVCKLCNNSGWGKLCEVPHHTKNEYIKAEDFHAVATNPRIEMLSAQIVDLFDGEETMRVRHRPKQETICANRYSAVHHSVLVTAYARVLLYEIVEKVGTGAGYMDTDSVMFEM